MVGQANIINKFANVRMEDLRGMRVPFLRVGWNRQFLMMKEFGFVYDSSMIAPFSNPPLWPYTLDYKMPHSCTGNNQHCPSRSYPGVWEMVMNQLEAGDYHCGMVDRYGFYCNFSCLCANAMVPSYISNIFLIVVLLISMVKMFTECSRTTSSVIMLRIELHLDCSSMRHGSERPNILMHSRDSWMMFLKCQTCTLLQIIRPFNGCVIQHQ